ncbi:MBL fold metallo-hydrolase [Microbacterium sulfonylureivorans]|uniref:MBL fold metallo-hydrolase n=1 Tax=Microbacterium sulfonylureivorans TaxID=2486854 RepID=UPI0013E088BB|nr:MBL fold metallo-hydrolase [Microbacterium sulfonylureivorans]
MTRPLPPVTVRRLGQAGYVLAAAGARMVLDPFLSDHPGRLVEPPLTPSDLSEADAILVTHEHLDHLDLPALAAMPASAARVFVPAPLAERVGAALPGREVIAVRAWMPIEVGGAVVVPVPALHGVHMSDAYSFGTEPDGDHPYVGYVVRIGGLTVFHAGDGLDYPDLAPSLRRLGVDVALLPINGRDAIREAADIVGNMSAEEAVDVAVRAGVSTVIPMHYDMFANNPGQVGAFVDLMRDAAPQIHVLVPGLSHEVPLPAPQTTGSPS